MADKSNIEWTDATWNCLYGCSLVSPGCKHCYAVLQTHRIAGVHDNYKHLTVLGDHGPEWSGDVFMHADKLEQPLRWQRPRMVFVNSLSDVFHPGVDDDFVAAMFAVMGAASQHQFQLLTKRPERMHAWFKRVSGLYGGNPWKILEHCERAAVKYGLNVNAGGTWPLRNVWIGVSVESQTFAEKRIPFLLQTPAAIRFLSMEPLLGAVDLTRDDWIHKLDWVIVGGESGPGARPMDPEWVRDIRDACVVNRVPFFMKQWGNFDADGVKHRSKKETGCLIDGVDYKQWPRQVAA